jgi:hypothetical protein
MKNIGMDAMRTELNRHHVQLKEDGIRVVNHSGWQC